MFPGFDERDIWAQAYSILANDIILGASLLGVLKPWSEAGRPQRYLQQDARHEVYMAPALAQRLENRVGKFPEGPCGPQPSTLWGHWLPAREALCLVDLYSVLFTHSRNKYLLEPLCAQRGSDGSHHPYTKQRSPPSGIHTVKGGEQE